MNALALLSNGYISRLHALVVSIPIPPAEGQNLLIKSLELPLPPSMTEALGIHQSDIIIRSAIVAAIADLRANPWLLDYVFASLPRDELTMKAYGENEVDQAKKWFMKTDIPVFMTPRIDEAKVPCISISLLESVESENTLGDVHYVPQEANDSKWPTLAGPFNPETYNAATGIMKVSAEIGDAIVIAKGMVVLDRVGRPYDILDILDRYTFAIKAGTVADFGNALLKSAKPSYVTQLESLAFRETYRVGCHAQGEPQFLTYLHSIVSFVLLRYKEALLEARGFERSTISSAQFELNEQWEKETVFSRSISITGFVRNYWPKAINPRIQGIEVLPDFEQTGLGAGTTVPNDPNDPSWLVEQDGIGLDTGKK